MNNAKTQAKATTTKRTYKKKLTKAEIYEKSRIQMEKDTKDMMRRREEEEKRHQEHEERIKKYYEDNKELIEKQKKQKELMIINEKKKNINIKYKKLDSFIKKHIVLIQLNNMNYDELEDEEDKINEEISNIKIKMSVMERMRRTCNKTYETTEKHLIFTEWKKKQIVKLSFNLIDLMDE